MLRNTWKWLDANKGGAGGGGGSGGAEGGSGDSGNQGGGSENKDDKQLVFDSWLGSQDKKVQEMLDGHIKGLKSALNDERTGRKELEKQLRELAGKAEKGSEAEKKLLEMADKQAEADRRTDFYDAAHAAGVSNLKLAYLAAVQDDLFDKRGLVNFEEMKKGYPELFGEKPKPKGNAGSGTGDEGNLGGKTDMDDFIRSRAK